MRLFLFCLLSIFLKNPDNPAPLYSQGTIQTLFQKDTTHKQSLYIGRLWRNQYLKVEGDQFLCTQKFLSGTVTMNGRIHKPVNLRYDIFNDEIVTLTGNGSLVQLNKEMVDSFSISFPEGEWEFINMRGMGEVMPDGYYRLLVKGNYSLLAAYRKRIVMIPDEKNTSIFELSQRIFIESDDILLQIRKPKELTGLIPENQKVIKDFLKNNRPKPETDEPESFIPLVEFINTLRK